MYYGMHLQGRKPHTYSWKTHYNEVNSFIALVEMDMVSLNSNLEVFMKDIKKNKFLDISVFVSQ